VKTSLSERDGNTVKLAVEVSSDELQEAFNARLKQLSREVSLPGFRPGKAPLTMVRQRAGDEMILTDAIEEAMGAWFAQAAVDLKLNPVERPQIELDDEKEIPELGKPLSFTATVTVMPEIVLGEYKGVEAPKELSEPTDQEVDSQVDRLRNEFAELRPISGRPAQSGDFVNVDLNATLDGQPVENLQASDFVFDLGGGRMFPEVEEQILGMNGGDEKAFPLTLPEGIDDLGGKTVDFTVSLKEIKEKALPPLTDQWASEVSEFPTLLELRMEIRNRIKAGKENASEQLFRARAVKAAADNATIDLPEVVVLEQAEEMLADFSRSLQSQGASLESYIEISGMSREEIVNDMKPSAANNVKTSLMLDAIAKAESLQPTDEELGALVAQMAAAGKVDAKTFENRLRKSGRIAALEDQIMRDKAADFIVKNAVATAPEPEPATAVDEAEPATKGAKTRKKASAAALKAPAAEAVSEQAPAVEDATETTTES
jgi:trigger factor